MELYRECIGKGAPVLLIHGVLSDHTFFSGVARNLATSCKAISYDRRGYGENPTAEGMDYSLAAQVEDAYQVLKACADTPACVVGHSAGANIALGLALKYPETVKQLVLIESSLAFNARDSQMIANWRDELAGYAERNQLLKIFLSFQKVTGTKRSEKPATPAKPQSTQMDRMRKNLKAFVYGEMHQMNAFVPDETQLRNLDIPVTVAVTQYNPDNIFWHTANNDGAHFDWPVVAFPGTHSSIEVDAEAFVNKLIEVLQF